MSELKAVDLSGNKFCGPLVVAAILGVSTGQVVEEIAAMRQELRGARLPSGKVKRVRNRTADKIRGTYTPELFAILARHGYKVEEISTGAHYRPAYRQRVLVNADGTRQLRLRYPIIPPNWQNAVEWTPIKLVGPVLWHFLHKLARAGRGTYIIETPGHWAIFSDGNWCETFTKGQWVDFRAARGQTRQVMQAWKVSRA